MLNFLQFKHDTSPTHTRSSHNTTQTLLIPSMSLKPIHHIRLNFPNPLLHLLQTFLHIL